MIPQVSGSSPNAGSNIETTRDMQYLQWLAAVSSAANARDRRLWLAGHCKHELWCDSRSISRTGYLGQSETAWGTVNWAKVKLELCKKASISGVTILKRKFPFTSRGFPSIAMLVYRCRGEQSKCSEKLFIYFFYSFISNQNYLDSIS
jgi:hypothetical protein